MIDFSNYTIYQQQAMNDVLHDLVERLENYGTIREYLREMRAKSDTQLTISIDAQFYRQAERSNAPELTVLVIPRKPLKLEPQDLRKFEELYNDHAAAEAEKVNRIKEACIAGAPSAEDPEPAPDMFGWVGDALDDLCAAGEVLGSDE